MKRSALWVVLVASLAAACTYGRTGSNVPVVVSTTPASAALHSPAPEPRPPSPTGSPNQTPSPAPSLTDVPPIGWYASVTVIDTATRARMKYSWHKGCPVPIKNLRLIRMSFLGFDRQVHLGEMVVHRSVAADVVKVFHAMFKAKFPIRRMRLIDDYQGDDDRSMAADNTSAFNCRKVTGGSDWSQHAYGWAIDIDPVENPYVSGGKVLPPSGARYADRSRHDRGMIHRGDAVYSAFRAVRWGWGGDWRSFQDFQHFSLTGR